MTGAAWNGEVWMGADGTNWGELAKRTSMASYFQKRLGEVAKATIRTNTGLFWGDSPREHNRHLTRPAKLSSLPPQMARYSSDGGEEN
jgi:hypothetical protein